MASRRAQGMRAGGFAFRGRHVIVRYVPDKAGIAACAMGPELREVVDAVARWEAQSYAQSISPRSDIDHQHYQDSFKVIPGTAWIAGMKRVAARLYNLAPHAAAVEWGNKATGHEGYRVLGQTLDYLNSRRDEP